MLHVAIHGGDSLVRGGMQPGEEGGMMTEIAGQCNQPHLGITAVQVGDALGGRVARPVIDEYQFEINIEIRNCRNRPRPNSRVTKGRLGSIDRQSALHMQFEAAVRVHVLPDQRREGAKIPGGKLS